MAEKIRLKASDTFRLVILYIGEIPPRGIKWSIIWGMSSNSRLGCSLCRTMTIQNWRREVYQSFVTTIWCESYIDSQFILIFLQYLVQSWNSRKKLSILNYEFLLLKRRPSSEYCLLIVQLIIWVKYHDFAKWEILTMMIDYWVIYSHILRVPWRAQRTYNSRGVNCLLSLNTPVSRN